MKLKYLLVMTLSSHKAFGYNSQKKAIGILALKITISFFEN